MYHIPLTFQCIYVCSDGGENRDKEEGREWRLPRLFYTEDFVLCGELEKDLRAMVEGFVKVCSRRVLKVNAVKSKVMVLNGEQGLECRWNAIGAGVAI